jgi:hypothetical protein
VAQVDVVGEARVGGVVDRDQQRERTASATGSSTDGVCGGGR